MVYPVPLTLALLMVNAPEPGLESVTLCVVVVPVLTLPNVSEDGLKPSTGEPTLTPVPASATVDAKADALLLIEIMPALLPAAEGSKLAVNEAVCPEVSVTGKESTETPNPVPLTVA